MNPAAKYSEFVKPTPKVGYPSSLGPLVGCL